MTVLRVSGKGAKDAFKNESGGHRWQRVPPSEKRGRVHTSTITVAVLPVPEAGEVQVDPRDLEWKTTRGSGPGGQHRNTTDSAVQLTHKPTGISVRAEGERSQHQNKRVALSILESRIAGQQREQELAGRAADRKQQVGCGARGDKRRTIALQRGRVVDHVLGAKMQAKAYLRGELDRLRK